MGMDDRNGDGDVNDREPQLRASLDVPFKCHFGAHPYLRLIILHSGRCTGGLD